MHHPRQTDPSPGDPRLLFAYGTLGPSDSRSVVRDGWDSDAVRGRLFDLGAYPALVDWDDPRAGWVEGHVREVDPIELQQRLDPYEGVSEGLFRRLVLRTRSGRVVWVYVYPHPVPGTAVGPLPRWDGPRLATESPAGRR